MTSSLKPFTKDPIFLSCFYMQFRIPCDHPAIKWLSSKLSSHTCITASSFFSNYFVLMQELYCELCVYVTYSCVSSVSSWPTMMKEDSYKDNSTLLFHDDQTRPSPRHNFSACATCQERFRSLPLPPWIWTSWIHDDDDVHLTLQLVGLLTRWVGSWNSMTAARATVAHVPPRWQAALANRHESYYPGCRTGEVRQGRMSKVLRLEHSLNHNQSKL